MNDDERKAKEFLDRKGYGEVFDNTGGNAPPDFIVDDKIAVEVRRLNFIQRFPDGATRGAEEVWMPIADVFSRILSSYGPSGENGSWFVFCEAIGEFPPSARPKNKKRIRKEIKQSLNSLLSGYWDGLEKELDCGMRIWATHTPTKHRDKFLFGGGGPTDRGGIVISDIGRNANICIEEKARKTNKHINENGEKYAEWWLMLVDRVSVAGLNFIGESEERQLLGAIRILPPFSKVIIGNHGKWLIRDSQDLTV